MCSAVVVRSCEDCPCFISAPESGTCTLDREADFECTDQGQEVHRRCPLRKHSITIMLESDTIRVSHR